MKICKKYVFCSPKSGGSTLVALNMAIQNQALEMEKKIAYLQLSQFPDAHVYASIPKKRTILDLKNFLDKKEFTKNILYEVAQKCGVDCFLSPQKKDWSKLKTTSLQEIIQVLEQEYDTLYFDISLSLENEFLEYCFDEAQKIVLVSFFSPPNLAAAESFFDIYQNFLSKVYLLFNQCPTESDSLIKKSVKNREINYLGILPIEEKYMWEQVFNSRLLAFEKKSKWSQSLLKILKTNFLS